MQQLSYTGIYVLALLMVATGFAMYGQSNPGGVIYSLTNWIGALFGGMQRVRFIHHVASWAFLIFIPIHIYLATRADVMERSGTISSIFTGGRFVRSDVKYVDE
jgi:Ni/Fe-hydrogenase b-type cytochrome subunit